MYNLTGVHIDNVLLGRVRVTLRTAVYRQSIRLGAKPLELMTRASFFFYNRMLMVIHLL
jgi:hypothetical protein